MNAKRLSLKELAIAGEHVPPASVRFKPGLNLIVGASDTGKTFIFEAIDFMLGAGDGLRRIPESEGYDRVLLSVKPTDSAEFTLQRAFEGGQFELIEVPDDSGTESPRKTLSHVHQTEPDRSLSSFLLRAIGLAGLRVRKNEYGATRALSFRDVAHLMLISEERIIRHDSPVVTSNLVNRTSEHNVFAYFLSGKDDSQIIAQEKKADRKARLNAEESVIQAILSEKQAELATISSEPMALVDQVRRLEEAIATASRSVFTTQEEITVIEKKRKKLFEEFTRAQSRLVFLGEQLKRLRLLDSYYISDEKRIEAVVEATRVFHELPEGSCPLCHQSLTHGTRTPSHETFEAATLKERQKIQVLQADLRKAITDLTREEVFCQEQVEESRKRLLELEDQLQMVVSPKARTVEMQLQELVKQRTVAAQGEMLLTTIQSLRERLDYIQQSRKERIQKEAFESRVTTAAASDFCQVVEEILGAWKYPDLGPVSFDNDKADIVIGNQDRTNKGKGYRAITYAAFTIGLMKYCRKKGIPHPGFVVIDTPVNPFKGPSSVNDALNDEVKASFFAYLAADKSGDQFIVMENEEPPMKLPPQVNYYHFSKNPDVGPYGFFPR